MNDENPTQRLLDQFHLAWPPERFAPHRIVAAVSGGADSMALLHLLHRSRDTAHAPMFVAHVDHQLRPNSYLDLKWLKSRCEHLSLPFLSAQIDSQSLTGGQGEGIEGRARRLRYDHLCRLAHEVGARYIVTGHTLNDQVESVLHRIVRGTGIDGLSGMEAFRELSPGITLARPLLQISRDQIEEFITSEQIEIRSDETNHDTQYTRNRIRHELLPWLRENLNPNVDSSLVKLAELAGEYEALLRPMAAALSADCRIHAVQDEVILDKSALRDQPELLVRAMVRNIWREQGWGERPMTHEHWSTLARWLIEQADNASRPPRGNQGNLATDRHLPPRLTLPNQIEASCQDEHLVLKRNRMTTRPKPSHPDTSIDPSCE